MPAYQSDYIDFYYSVMDEVNELTRIKVHERVKSYLQNKYYSFKNFIKYNVIGRIKDYFIRLKKQFFPPKKGEFRWVTIEQPKKPSSGGMACMAAPLRDDSLYTPMNELISLSQFAYGRMIDQKFKKRFIDIRNYRSKESILSLKKEAVNYIYKQKLESSLKLRIAVFLHFT